MNTYHLNKALTHHVVTARAARYFTACVTTRVATCVAALLALLASLLCSSAFAADAADLLPPEQAFPVSVGAIQRTADGTKVEVVFDTPTGYYLYRNKLHFTAAPPAQAGEPVLPKGELHQDETFGQVETYRHKLSVTVPLNLPAGTQQASLEISSQGCADAGVCYPPMQRRFAISTDQVGVAEGGAPRGKHRFGDLFSGSSTDTSARQNVAVAATSSSTQNDTPSNAPHGASASPLSESDDLAARLSRNSVWATLATFFGLGLVLAFTPCVFPMIPILSGIIVGHGHSNSHARAAWLSAAYVFGMAATYALAGVAAGLSGNMLSAALQNVWVLSAFALIFVALSGAMFGFYELQLPAALQSRLSQTANNQGGSFFNIVLMGALSALIVGPCVAAPLAGALLYIARTGDAVLGGSALFMLALGMGVPLFAVGIASRSLLPKSGPWMDGVKKFFGVLMLGMALYLVSPVMPPMAVMLGWGVLLIGSGVALHATDALPKHTHIWQRIGKALGLLCLLAGIAQVVGGLAGSSNPLQPLAGLFANSSSSSASTSTVKFTRIHSLAELQQRLQTSKRPVILDFYADWCVSCKEMEHQTFSDPTVAQRMQDFELLQADVTANTDDDKALLKRFELFGPPGILFFDRAGNEMRELRVVGFKAPQEFLPTLQAAAK